MSSLRDSSGLLDGIGLLGLGAYVPERVLTNDDWAERVDTTDAWITARTGIKRRRVAAPEQSTVDLAIEAARGAFSDAEIEPSEVDEIIVATDTPEVYIPDTAPYVQNRLGIGPVPSYDLAGSGCAGFLQALDVARSRVACGKERILVVGVELLTRLMNWTDRNTCVLFGDAAGAAVVGRDPKAGEILAVTAGTDGSRADILSVEVGGTRSPFSLEAAQQNLHQEIAMNGKAVFREAVRHMEAASRKLLDELGLEIEDLALVVPHQANLRIIQAVASALKAPMSRVIANVEEYGNTGSASIPLALWEARGEGRVRPGDLVLLTSFGAGFHWAAMVLRF